MGDHSNVFEDKDKGQDHDQEHKPQETNDFSDQLKEIKSEDGRQKYESVDEALKALNHSQTYIPELQGKLDKSETELVTLRKELAKRDGVQEILDKLDQHQNQDKGETTSIPGLDEASVLKLINNTLTSNEQAGTLKANEDAVNNKLIERFGTKAPDVVAQKAKELGTTPEELGKLSRTKPTMVLALFNSKQASPSPTTTSFKTGLTRPAPDRVQRPEKSLLSGATSDEQKEFFIQVKKQVYADNEIDS